MAYFEPEPCSEPDFQIQTIGCRNFGLAPAPQRSEPRQAHSNRTSFGHRERIGPTDTHHELVQTLYERLVLLREQGVTVVLAEQSVELALEIADYGHVLQTGRTALECKARDLEQDADVQRVYLGLEMQGAAERRR
jgi:hypothetical protein